MSNLIMPARFQDSRVPFFTDDFNRANENLEASANWNRVGGTAGQASVSTNKLTLGSTNTTYQCPDAGSFHQYAECDITAKMDAYLACRAHNNNNYVGLRPFSTSEFQIYQYNGNALTKLADVNFNGIGHRIRLQVQGNQASAFIDGVLRAGPVTLIGNHRGGSAGFICRNFNYTEIIDNFEFGTLPFATGLFIPDVATFTDNFNRANGNLETDPNWTRVGGVAGACQVNSNSLSFSSTTDTAYQGPNLGSADHWCQATRLTATTGGHFLACRLQDTSNYIGCRQSGGDLEIYKKVSNTFTLLGGLTRAPVAGETWRLEVVGTTATFYVNGQQMLTVATGAHTSTPTTAGFLPRANNAANLWDDYSQGLMVAA